jgi:hypothetical protein
LPEVLEAIRFADARYATIIYVSAVSARSFLLTQGVGTAADDMRAVLGLVDEAHQLLRRRRVPSRHPHMLKLRGIRALALARLGSVELAERMLGQVVDGLREQGRERDAKLAAEQLLWIVEDRCGQVGRGRLMRRKLGLPSAEPAAVTTKTATPSKEDDPIGF